MSTTQFAVLTQQLASQLLSRGCRLATAESCTGGWLAKTLTDLPGSSRWFECGYVTYSNEAKMRDLGVLAQTLERHGAVSQATALEMASGALKRAGADVSISITGVAGPDGGTPDKPIGTVWFAVALREGRAAEGRGPEARELACDAEARVQQFQGDRDAIRSQSVKFALEWLVAIQVPGNSTTV